MNIELSKSEILKLKKLHRQLKNKRDAKNAYRVNTIILIAKGYSYSEVAEIFLLDEATIREYCRRQAFFSPFTFAATKNIFRSSKEG